MSMRKIIERGGETIVIEGVLSGEPSIGEIPGGASYATCTIRTHAPVGTGEAAQNNTWPVVIHRPPAVEQMKAAMPGDMLEIHGVVRDGRITVPRTNGRIDLLFTE